MSLEAAKTGLDYKCSTCKVMFPRILAVIDHIKPVIDPKKGWQGFEVYIKRLWCSSKNLQVLCKPCHKLKSVAENAIRRLSKKKRS